MEQIPIAEILPGLYRAVLDAVATLERVGRRREAGEIRSDAIAAYSRAWDSVAERRLRTLRAKAERLAEPRRRVGPEALEARRRAVDLEKTAI